MKAKVSKEDEDDQMGDIAELSDKDRRIIYHANDMLWFWRSLNQLDPKGSGGFYEQRARQAYHDSLLSLKNNELIDGYDVVGVSTLLGGKWYSDRRELKFVPTGPEIEVT